MKITDKQLIESLNDPDKLYEHMLSLVNLILNYYDWEFEFEEEIIKSAATYGLKKAEKFKTTNDKAFNFFTTCIACYLRQELRIKRYKNKLVN